MTDAPNAPKVLSPADYVIGKLGGLTRAASKIKVVKKADGTIVEKPDGLPVTTVQGWSIRKRIPQDHWGACIDAAAAEGVTLSLADFLNEHEDTEEQAA